MWLEVIIGRGLGGTLGESLFVIHAISLVVVHRSCIPPLSFTLDPLGAAMLTSYPFLTAISFPLSHL